MKFSIMNLAIITVYNEEAEDLVYIYYKKHNAIIILWSWNWCRNLNFSFCRMIWERGQEEGSHWGVWVAPSQPYRQCSISYISRIDTPVWSLKRRWTAGRDKRRGTLWSATGGRVMHHGAPAAFIYRQFFPTSIEWTELAECRWRVMMKFGLIADRQMNEDFIIRVSAMVNQAFVLEIIMFCGALCLSEGELKSAG